MLAQFAWRLAVALPLLCLLAALSLWVASRGWLRLPAIFQRRPAPPPETAAPLKIVCVRALAPGARLALVRFAGRDLLIGLSGNALVLLAGTEPSARPATGEGEA